MSPLPQTVIATSTAWEGSLSPNHAVPAMQPRPLNIIRRTVTRRCLRNPRISAMAPKSATSSARLRCTLSSAGRKCAATADRDSSTGVIRQWMRHRAEVHIPSLSAHCRDPAAKTGDVEDMRVSDYCEWTLICKSESVADLPSALNASSSFMPRSNADEKTCAHTDRLLVTCRKAVVVGWLQEPAEAVFAGGQRSRDCRPTPQTPRFAAKAAHSTRHALAFRTRLSGGRIMTNSLHRRDF